MVVAQRLDRSDLERELERLHPESWGWALACTRRDRDAAHDALQTAYVRILSGTARFGGASAFKTWVFGVIRHTAMEEHRRRHAAEARHAEHDSFDVADGRLAADVALEHSERATALESAMALLSLRQREVLQLVFYHDMTIEAAAVVMRVSVGSARVHYDRAKKALAAHLAHAPGGIK
jgi:RNA polymerase sigma factor (sigma-70 family)